MASVDSGVASSNSEEHCEEINIEEDAAAGISSANANRCKKASAGEQSAMESRRKDATPYCVYVPPTYFQKEAGRQSSNVDGKQLIMSTIDKHLVNFNNSPSTITPITQSQLDDHIMDYIIQDTLPLSGVEKGGFVKLMSGLVGTLQLKKRKYFTEKLKQKFSNTKTALIMALKNALYRVCVTITDNGSNFLKAFRVFGPTTNEQELSENSEDCEEEF
ncbi:hypothetical protein OUZ56_029726 [Daphnia magna]|uniref:Uncharacterized protein n=1 Tax=Daphnia magna TaxID=35525 RepID=A0ABR0B7N2_9CRUS|nr:hypothetical protein OUZ56_029726 [Daphnia magna]